MTGQGAAGLADPFEQDRRLAEQLNACQDRLRAANGRLWSGLHPDALGLIYDDAAAVGGGLKRDRRKRGRRAARWSPGG